MCLNDDFESLCEVASFREAVQEAVLSLSLRSFPFNPFGLFFGDPEDDAAVVWDVLSSSVVLWTGIVGHFFRLPAKMTHPMNFGGTVSFIQGCSVQLSAQQPATRHLQYRPLSAGMKSTRGITVSRYVEAPHPIGSRTSLVMGKPLSLHWCKDPADVKGYLERAVKHSCRYGYLENFWSEFGSGVCWWYRVFGYLVDELDTFLVEFHKWRQGEVSPRR